MHSLQPSTYGGGEYDRRNNDRASPAVVESYLNNPTGQYLLFDGRLRLFLTEEGLPRRFSAFDARAFLSEASAAAAGDAADAAHLNVHPPLFLGTDAGSGPLCALRLSGDGLAGDGLFDPARFADLRDLSAVLPRSTLALIAHARSLFAFHDAHRYCGMCGARTRSVQGGAQRRCERSFRAPDSPPPTSALPAPARQPSRCRGVWYPRTDPAVIMLIIDSARDRVLLGRQARFPRSDRFAMYSCLAGHMEHGEGVDDAVRRETSEEVGVNVGTVRFFGSQPWPFPYTLMLACVVQAESVTLDVDRNELEDALWVSRAELQAMVDMRVNGLESLEGGSADESEEIIKFVPPAATIAGQMIGAFLAREDICKF